MTANQPIQATATVRSLPNSRVEIRAAVAGDYFKTCRPRALAELGKKLTVAGFRPGRVPPAIVAEQAGENLVLQTAAEIAIREAYPALLAEHRLDALDQPVITITKLAWGEPLAFTAVTDVYPLITLPAYEPLVKAVAKPATVIVTTEEIDRLMTEAGAQENGTITREEARQRLIRNKEWHEREKYRVQLIKKITTALTVEIPSSLLEAELDKMLAELITGLGSTGLSLAAYLQQIGKTEEEVREAFRPQAEERVKFGLFANALAEAEKLQPTADQIAAAAAALKNHYPHIAAARLQAYVAGSLAQDAVWQKLESLN